MENVKLCLPQGPILGLVIFICVSFALYFYLFIKSMFLLYLREMGYFFFNCFPFIICIHFGVPGPYQENILAPTIRNIEILYDECND